MRTETPRSRITKTAQERRQDILDAAVAVFARKGIGGATVADIAQAAGVAKGTFYLYFQTKEHLLAALRESLVEQTLERGASFYERVGRDDWWGLVDGMLEAMIDLMLSHRDAILVFTQEGMSADTRATFAACDRQLNEMVAGGIQAGVDAGVFEVADPYATATLLHHAIEGAVLEAILYEPEWDRERLLAAAKELVHRALAPGAS